MDNASGEVFFDNVLLRIGDVRCLAASVLPPFQTAFWQEIDALLATHGDQGLSVESLWQRRMQRALFVMLRARSANMPEKTSEGSLLRYHVERDRGHLADLKRHVVSHSYEARAYGQSASGVVRKDWTWRAAAKKLADLFSLRCSNAIEDAHV